MADELKDLVAKKSSLERELTQWQQKAALAKADEERLRGEIVKGMQVLQSEFGCSSYQEAVEKREAMLTELKESLDELEAKLNALSGV